MLVFYETHIVSLARIETTMWHVNQFSGKKVIDLMLSHVRIIRENCRMQISMPVLGRSEA